MENEKFIVAKLEISGLGIEKDEILDYEVMKKRYGFVDWNNPEYFEPYIFKYSPIKNSTVKISPSIRVVLVGGPYDNSMEGVKGYTNNNARDLISDRFYTIKNHIYDKDEKKIYYLVVGVDHHKRLWVEEKYLVPFKVRYTISKKGEIWETSNENTGSFTKTLGNIYWSREEAKLSLDLIKKLNNHLQTLGYGKILSYKTLLYLEEHFLGEVKDQVEHF